MRTKFYLHVKENGSTRTTKNKVATYVDEISIAMEIDLPDSLFEKPIITGKITITDDMVTPRIIEADTKEAIRNALQSIEGVKIELSIEEPEEVNP